MGEEERGGRREEEREGHDGKGEEGKSGCNVSEGTFKLF